MSSQAIAIIPARGGSKRIPKKNIKEFFHKPIIAYSIESALKSGLFKKVIVSTDDKEIAKIAKEYGADVPFLRPKHLSNDFTGTAAVINHTLKYLEKRGETYQYICTIYATAPLLQTKYLVQGFHALKNSNAVNAFSATSMPFPIQRTFKLDDNGRCEMFMPQYYMSRSQDLEEAYQDAGQFYWKHHTRDNNSKNKMVFSEISIPIIIPRYLVQDIDTLEDWSRAEFMYEAIQKLQIKENILFRADSSSTIGTGHIMRDLVLASQYKDANIIFATQELPNNINHKILDAKYSLEILQTNSFKELNTLIKKLNIETLVIDHYEIDKDFEQELKTSNPNLKIFVLDDTYKEHICDTLLNHNICADASRYTNLVPPTCEILCGKEHTLLRDEFYKEKRKLKKKKTDSKKKTLFISMGGADSSHINIEILKVLKKFENIQVDLLTTKANKNLKELQEYTQNKKWIHLHIDSTKVAKIMRKSDFAIISPSLIANEILFMGLDFLTIQTATNNQNEMSVYLQKNGYPTLQNFSKKHLYKMLQKVL